MVCITVPVKKEVITIQELNFGPVRTPGSIRQGTKLHIIIEDVAINGDASSENIVRVIIFIKVTRKNMFLFE